MTQPDVVLARLAELSPEMPSPALSRKIRTAAHARLLPAKVHPVFGLLVAASVVVYLGWALLYTGQLG